MTLKKHFRYGVRVTFYDGNIGVVHVYGSAWFEWLAYIRAMRVWKDDAVRLLESGRVLGWTFVRLPKRVKFGAGGPVQ